MSISSIKGRARRRIAIVLYWPLAVVLIAACNLLDWFFNDIFEADQWCRRVKGAW